MRRLISTLVTAAAVLSFQPGCSTLAGAVVGTGIGSVPGDTSAGALLTVETAALHEVFDDASD